ncbi:MULTISPECIES: amidohydrolase family protein [Actinoalloteichus]|uniref:amidohydrolase family protein n=1 Tax=Actinoalloteichus TaxID=65496 RepID=UPI00037805F2|nr:MULTISPECIES: amidohydrolase family protein [Actinoalloteichus]
MSGGRIDLHAHYLPDFYREALAESGHGRRAAISSLPEWDEQLALRTMDRLGVRTAMLSVSTPGVHFGDADRAVDLARRVNEEGARLVRAHPGRFGFFASLPLPEVEPAVAELRHAFDVLGADGVILQSNHHGLYLGDERLEPVYAEVAARGSVVFVHPAMPFVAEHLALGYPQPALEFPFDTTRSVVDLVLSGVLERHPDLRVVVSHAGAVLPVLANRVDLLVPMLAVPKGRTTPSLRAAMRRLHFDLAGAPVPELLGALLSLADPDRLHYGSDYPFFPAALGRELADRLAETPLLDGELRRAVFEDNAVRLFPRLASPTS